MLLKWATQGNAFYSVNKSHRNVGCIVRDAVLSLEILLGWGASDGLLAIPINQRLSLSADGWSLVSLQVWEMCLACSPIWHACSACWVLQSLAQLWAFLASKRLGLTFHIPGSPVSENLQFGFTNDPIM